MKQRTALIGCLLLAVVVGLGQAARGEFFFKDKDRIVFLGDSITQQQLYTTYIEGYVLTRFPQWSFTFRNAGWSGDTAWMRQRTKTDDAQLFAATDAVRDELVVKAVAAGLGRDVLPLKPTAVTIDFGMNDHAYQGFREDIFKAYVRSQTELARVLATNGARVALVTPQPIEEHRPDPDQDVRNQSLRKFSDGLKDVAAREGALYVDQFGPYMGVMLAARAAKANAYVGGGDAVHPGPAGQTLMAWAILKGLSATSLVSSADFDVARVMRGKLLGARQCRISGVKYAGGVLSFDRLDAALPMPIDPRATAAVDLAPVLDDLSRYLLTVAGLKAERYEVSIDGAAVATVAAPDLAKGWNMATAATPAATQALQVLDLVFKKNQVYYERWRKVQLASGAPERLAELDRQIADLETQIDRARQPVSHHFELKPVR
jgi:lysophospholipase L1-like esterase